MPKLVCMLRVKDGILFVDQWLANMERLVDEIVVVDNGSTDGTFEILKSHSKVVQIEQTEGFHEGRDKILAYEMARRRNPDWMLWLDIDEIFEERVTREKFDKMMSSKHIKMYYFRRYHLHRDDRHFESGLDKLINASVPDRILWKEQETGYFLNRKIHNGLIQGIKGIKWISNFRIKHYGQLDKEYLERKTEIYLSVDPDRKDLYIKHRDQSLPVWKWFEYSERKFFIKAQNLFFTILFYITFFIKR